MKFLSHSNYLGVMKAQLEAHGTTRGYRTKMAAAMGVHPSYVTRILDQKVSITPDQATSLAHFWALPPKEAEYFFWLVMASRAGTSTMKKMAQSRLEVIRSEDRDLRKALEADAVSPALEEFYFSNWIYCVIHVLGTIPGMTVQKAARRLRQPSSHIKAVVHSLQKAGLLVVSAGGGFKATQMNIYVGKKHWLGSIHHQNIRALSMARVGAPELEDLRFSGVHSVSRQDLGKIKEMVEELMTKVNKIVRASSEETLAILTCDLFEFSEDSAGTP